MAIIGAVPSLACDSPRLTSGKAISREAIRVRHLKAILADKRAAETYKAHAKIQMSNAGRLMAGILDDRQNYDSNHNSICVDSVLYLHCSRLR